MHVFICRVNNLGSYLDLDVLFHAVRRAIDVFLKLVPKSRFPPSWHFAGTFIHSTDCPHQTQGLASSPAVSCVLSLGFDGTTAALTGHVVLGSE